MSKAIELADKLDYLADNDAKNWQTLCNAASELRRLAAVEQELAACKSRCNAAVGQADALRQELADLKATMGEPMAWLSDESVRRLARGGNDSRGTVPVHAVRSGVSCNPLYAIKAAK